MSEPQTLMSGLVVGESPRWHEGRLWFSNWGAREIVAVDVEGKKSEVMAETSPLCLGRIGRPSLTGEPPGLGHQ